jgi:uncharacterized BrkB/YihY/UPF0761 family membrane protein
MLGHTLHMFHEHDLFTSAAAMSYFGLMALFPALLLLLTLSNKLAAGSRMLAQAVDVYPGSSKFLRDTIEGFSDLGFGAIITCVILVFWAGSWVFAVANVSARQSTDSRYGRRRGVAAFDLSTRDFCARGVA